MLFIVPMSDSKTGSYLWWGRAQSGWNYHSASTVQKLDVLHGSLEGATLKVRVSQREKISLIQTYLQDGNYLI